MIIKKDTEVPEEFLNKEGMNNVIKRVLIGPQDGSRNIIMRYFKLLPGGNSPYHTHNYEHVVKVEKGKGKIADGEGKEVEITEGQSLLIKGKEKHQFKNPFQKPFEFLCIILNPEKVS